MNGTNSSVAGSDELQPHWLVHDDSHRLHRCSVRDRLERPDVGAGDVEQQRVRYLRRSHDADGSAGSVRSHHRLLPLPAHRNRQGGQHHQPQHRRQGRPRDPGRRSAHRQRDRSLSGRHDNVCQGRLPDRRAHRLDRRRQRDQHQHAGSHPGNPHGQHVRHVRYRDHADGQPRSRRPSRRTATATCSPAPTAPATPPR